MRISKRTMMMGSIQPNLVPIVEALARNQTRTTLGGAALGGITDNSGGVAGAVLVAVPTITASAVPAGANLAQRASFNTAMDAVAVGIATLSDYLRVAYTSLGIADELGDHPEVPAVAGTIAAIPAAVTGVDGTAGDAMLRAEANSVISRQRNNLSTLARAYNALATAVGVDTLPNETGGNAATDGSFSTTLTADTAVAAGDVATSDLASAADATASLVALRNNIATLADSIDTVLFADLDAREPIILTP